MFPCTGANGARSLRRETGGAGPALPAAHVAAAARPHHLLAAGAAARSTGPHLAGASIREEPLKGQQTSGGLILPASYQRQQKQQQQQQQPPAQPGSEAAAVGAASAAAAAAEDSAATAPGKKPFRISWAGSGIYFWWQLGAMQYLASRYDLTQVPHGGASGGALAAALARCGVDPEAIVESAYRLSVDHKIWDRPLGLVGVWGSLIERWLAELLPHDAAARCNGGLGVVVTQLPSCRQVWIDDFSGTEDLINCCMASAHVPLLLDFKLTRRCRGAECVDGSFPDFFTGANCDHIQWGGDAVVFDYFFDETLQRNGRFDMLQLKEYSAIKRIALQGARYAARLEDAGVYAEYDIEAVRKDRGAPAAAAKGAANASAAGTGRGPRGGVVLGGAGATTPEQAAERVAAGAAAGAQHAAEHHQQQQQRQQPPQQQGA